MGALAARDIIRRASRCNHPLPQVQETKRFGSAHDATLPTSTQRYPVPGAGRASEASACAPPAAAAPGLPRTRRWKLRVADLSGVWRPSTPASLGQRHQLWPCSPAGSAGPLRPGSTPRGPGDLGWWTCRVRPACVRMLPRHAARLLHPVSPGGERSREKPRSRLSRAWQLRVREQQCAAQCQARRTLSCLPAPRVCPTCTLPKYIRDQDLASTWAFESRPRSGVIVHASYMVQLHVRSVARPPARRAPRPPI